MKVEGARVEVGELVVLLEPGRHLLEVVAEEVRAEVVEVLGEEVHTATLEGRSDCSGWMFLEGELVRSATLACRWWCGGGIGGGGGGGGDGGGVVGGGGGGDVGGGLLSSL